MKVLFAGPSIHGADPDLTEIELRAPAGHGDVAGAVLEGATAIGLIDGNFEAVASVWHKEILFALESGVRVLGASSMGALRAAECAPYGMIPIGEIARAYLDGSLDDDAAVALTHGPAELGFMPLTEPLVDVSATLRNLLRLGLISNAEQASIWARASAIYFKDRTVESLFPEPTDRAFRASYLENRVAQKTLDALQLISDLRALENERGPLRPSTLAQSFFVQRILPSLKCE